MEWEVSVLGFGVTRLPLKGKDPASIDDAESINILRYAIDHGVNYLNLDCKCDICGYERLSRLICLALQGDYRQKIKIAVNISCSLIISSRNIEYFLDNQLKWLHSESIDFFLLGGLNRETWPILNGLDILPWADSALADGRIGKLGFAFHDHFQSLREIIGAYDKWSLCQFEYSYMDIDHHPGIGGLKFAADKGLAVVVTNPLKGGWLTKEPPKSVAKVWANAPHKRTLAEWGLNWAWNLPEVSTVVSDMSTMKQVVENIDLADSAEADSLTVAEQVLISQVRDAYRKLRHVPCTSCRGCMPCPQGIDVPRIFELYNDAIMYDDIDSVRSIYNFEGHRIDNCNECGACLNACGRKIPVLDWLKVADSLFNGY